MLNAKDPFVHLHNHSHYSVLDGHALTSDIVNEAKRLGQPAVAVTDHGNMNGVYDLQAKAVEAGIIPIFGIEAYMAPVNPQGRLTRERVFYGDRSSENREELSNDVSGNGAYTHMTLFAESNEGLGNLFKLTSISYEDGYYRKPRMDSGLLAEHSKGIIGTTGCPSGEIQTRIRLGQYSKALEYAAMMQDILGKENYYLELMDHNMSIDLERRVLGDLMRLSKDLGIPLLATNDSHYATKGDARAHEHMLCMQTKSYMSDPTYDEGGSRFAFNGQGYYLKSYKEMAELFPESDFPGALSNTLEIAERAQGVKLEYRDDLRPSVEVPSGYTIEEFLKEEAYKGLRKRYPEITPEVEGRINLELDVITSKNFSTYFLVVSDFVRWAKRQGFLVGPGRGSAGGSLLAYALDITDLDPIRHNLIFERFLNPERDSAPDIDLDFSDKDRAAVIEYVTNKYGHDNVASIITFTKMGVKSGIKDVARILKKPYELGEYLVKKIPPADAGKEITFAEIYDTNSTRYESAHDFRAAVIERDAEDVINVAKTVEGRIKAVGVHAAGIIISSKPLMETIPLMVRQNDKAVITQFDYPTCEKLGLLKVDFLGIKNLTIIKNAVDNIKVTRGIEINISEITQGAMDDKTTFDLLQRGDTLGTFQLDSSAIRELLRRMKPTNFNDISAVLALYRPGPMGMNSHNEYADRKNGIKSVVYPHPSLEEPLKEVLSSTYGLCIYQEQVMKIAQVMAGYTLAQADNLRRAMGKKKKDVLDLEYIPFSQGAKKNGYKEDAIKAIWDVLVPFSEYGFNLSHAVGYAVLSYITCYLKANFPAEYMSAVISNASDDKDKLAIYIQECKDMGIEVGTPSVNQAGIETTPVDKKTVVLGLAGVRGISEERSALIVEARKDGRFNGFVDFLQRVPRDVVNKTVIEGLIKAGAFDEFESSRRSLMEALPGVLRRVTEDKKKLEKGQMSLFEDISDATLDITVPEMAEYSKQEKLKMEREALGLYVSDHPLSGIKETLGQLSNASVIQIINGTIPSVEGFGNNDTPSVTIAGVITSIASKRTKKGDEFYIITLEDGSGVIECTIFTRTLERYKDIISNDTTYVVTGYPRVREQGDTPTLTVNSLEKIELDRNGKIPFYLRLTENQITPASLDFFKRAVKAHPGDSPTYISIKKRNEITTIALDDEYKVSPNQLFRNRIASIFGNECVGKWS